MLIDLTDPIVIEAFARRDPGLHCYELGDLDPAFWPRTRWWGWVEASELAAIAVLYEQSTLLIFGDDPARALAAAIRDQLPRKIHAHLSPGVVTALGPGVGERHLKMVLHGMPPASDGVRAVTAADVPALEDLYRRAYPSHWFDPRMLATQQYFAIFEAGLPVCVAGVHVYAPGLRVAAIGNVATDPRTRGRGLAGRVMAHLCRSLGENGIVTIGLNVAAANTAAIRCYERLGFVTVAEFDVFALQLTITPPTS